jgi:Zn-dependent protease
MSDPLTWSPLSLGRWFGTPVRVHISLILFVVIELVWSAVNLAAKGDLPRLPQTAWWLVLLIIALAVHELGHAATAAWLDCDQEEVHLWPLGSLVGPSLVPRSSEHFLVAMAGPLTSGALFLGTAVGLSLFADARVVWNPFGNHEGDLGAPRLHNGRLATPLGGVWFIGWFGYLNAILALTNLIPALPFDFGRMFRALMGSTSIIAPRESIAAPWTALACAFLLVIIGLFRLVFGHSDGLTLIALAILLWYLVRREARMVEDDGYFDDGVFGYDFSEGYTSLENSAAKVRPYRESALKRWRRRRSELRRQRRLARDAAEERRMDEILEKLHREGRGALSDEEHRFLVRVSARYRNRTKRS